MINIQLVDSNNIVRHGIKELFNNDPELNVVAESSDFQSTINQLQEGIDASIMLLSLYQYFSQGMELIKKVRNHYSDVRIVIITEDNMQVVNEALRNGASGLFLLSSSIKELKYGLYHVLSGKTYICSDIGLNLLSKDLSSHCCNGKAVILSSRELEVLKLVVEGLTNSQIADMLFTSKRTVEGYRQQLLNKTGSANTARLVRYALINQLAS